jgi:hypothetical protein
MAIAYKFVENNVTHVAVHLSALGGGNNGLGGQTINFTAYAYCDVGLDGVPVAGSKIDFSGNETCFCKKLDPPLGVGCNTDDKELFLAVNFSKTTAVSLVTPFHIGVTFYCRSDGLPPV